MAKISSPWVGISSGKLGEGVYYHRSGRQCARARNRQPANPKSAAQSMQRMVLATTAKLTKALEPIVNHSWEGKAVGLTSVNFFRSLAMKAFRAAAVDGLSADSTIKADFCLKGSPTFGICENIPVSRGSLSPIKIGSVSSKIMTAAWGGTGSGFSATISDEATYKAALADIFCEPGDQLTFIVVKRTDNVVATFGEENDYEHSVVYSRVTFKKEWSSGMTGKLASDAGVLNPVFIEKSEGTLPDIEGGAQLEIDLEGMSPYNSIIAATIIRSKKLENQTVYSSANLIIDASEQDENDCQQTYPSYMDGAESVQVGTQLYLRNAVASLA